MKKNKKLQITHLEAKLSEFAAAEKVAQPPIGWIKAVRTSLGMTLKQMAKRLSITKQSAMEIEKREQEGSITLRALREAAHALDMELVYGLAPKDGTLHSLIERKARALAKEIVLRTAQSMKLEDQGNSEIRLKEAIEERMLQITYEMPKTLWD
jgi:predicted DNA-binding mobile mystery protein A